MVKKIDPEHSHCCDHDAGSASSEEDLAESPIEGKTTLVFKIQGMDCAEETAILKKVLSPLVGGVANLAFDLLNGKLIILKTEQPLDQEKIMASIAKLGMQATPWGTMEVPKNFYRAHQRFIFTSISGLSLALGFVLHWHLHGGFEHALLAGDGVQELEFPVYAILLYSVSILFGGWFVFPRALGSLKRLQPDMNLLMTVAIFGAIVLGQWLEAATVAFLFSVSLLLESWSLERAKRATKALLDLAPINVNVLEANGVETSAPANTVSVGAFFVVKPGERFPLDGAVFKGVSEVNQAPITGESIPVYKKEGDTVFAGTINGDGALVVVCRETSEHSTLSNIIRLVGDAHAQRAPVENWVDGFAKVYTPAVMGLALLVLLLPPLLFSGNWGEWFYRSLVLLVIACPCALVISTPVSIVAALTAAAKNGVLIKGGKFIELPSRLRSIAFDKTGTITQGNIAVIKVIPFDRHTEADLLKIAASIEARGEHPIARAIVLYAGANGIKFAPAENYQAIQGKGATAVVDGEPHWVGSHRYLDEKGQEDEKVHQRLEELSELGHTVVVIGNNDHVCGFITLADTIRPGVKGTLQVLRSQGIEHMVMLTGDNKGTARLISEASGIDLFFSELLPQDKVSKIDELVSKMGPVAMVGDGINDAPAMARSNLGISMAANGSDAAIESADIALMSNDLNKISWLIAHSKRTMGIIKQNIGFSLSIKVIFVVLTFLGHASMWSAITADMGASLLVIFNGLRLLIAVEGM